MEALEELSNIASVNENARRSDLFLGAGMYHH